MFGLGNVTSNLPKLQLPTAEQVVRNARSITVYVIAVSVLSALEVASAADCEESERICVRSCLGGGDGREAGACLLGCKLAYLFCKWFS